MKKILIIRFSSIGDIVLTSPVVRCLKKQIPNSEIHFLTKSSFKSVLANNPYLTKVWTFSNDLDEVLPALKLENFDFVIDLHKNIRSRKVVLTLGVKTFAFDKLNIQKWMLVNLKINKLPAIHIVDRYLKTVASLGVLNDNQGLDYFISDADIVPSNKIPDKFHSGFVAFVIGAKHATKVFPVNKLLEVIEQLDMPIVLLGGKEDRERGEEIVNASKKDIWNTCGEFSLNQSASLLQQSKVVVANDTGLMHIAAAFKKPIVSIWGNTVPEFGMTPYEPQHEVQLKLFQISNLSCRPCSKIGFDSCPKKHFKCMNDISSVEVAESIKHLY